MASKQMTKKQAYDKIARAGGLVQEVMVGLYGSDGPGIADENPEDVIALALSELDESFDEIMIAMVPGPIRGKAAKAGK